MENQTLPCSMTMETAVLAALIFDSSVWWRVVGVVSESDFFSLRHRAIYTAIREMMDAARPVDAMTLLQHLVETGKDIKAGGQEYLAELIRESSVSSANTGAYAAKLRELSLLRQLIHESERIREAAMIGGSASQIISDSSLAIGRLGHGLNADSSARQLSETAGAWIDGIEEGFRSNGMVGVATGLPDLDSRTKGLRGGHLVVLAARPSVGKSLLALNMAMHMSSHGKRVMFVSREMAAEEIHSRLCSAYGRCDHDKLVACDMADSEVGDAMAKYTAMVKHWDMLIDDGNDDSLTAIASTVRDKHREKPLDVVFVDYLQLLRVPGMEPFSTQEVSEVSRALKRLAVELNVPIVAVAQLNRGSENRKDQRPRSSDLRQSGQIEQDANVIMLLHRDMDENAPQDTAELIISKLRHGKRGIIPLTAHLHHQRFECTGYLS